MKIGQLERSCPNSLCMKVGTIEKILKSWTHVKLALCYPQC